VFKRGLQSKDIDRRERVNLILKPRERKTTKMRANDNYRRSLQEKDPAKKIAEQKCWTIDSIKVSILSLEVWHVSDGWNNEEFCLLFNNKNSMLKSSN
jgi:hypothetical protein